MLGSSAPGAEVPPGDKGVCTLENRHGQAGDRTVALQCPVKEHSPQRWGQGVGGVSEGAGAKAGGSNLSAMKIPSRVVTVKGILVF